MNLDAYAFSDKGGRSHNEDCVGYKTDGSRGIFVVADGLGGHAAGEVASALVTNDLLEAWDGTTGPVDIDWLRKAIAQANDHIVEEQQRLGNRMHTTVVVLAIEDGRALWAHVGDSRLYHLHEGALASVTADHSVAYAKYRSGEISRAQIAEDPDQSRLLKTLGNTGRLRVDCGGWGRSLGEGDSFFLCTDGVWEYLSDTEILVDRLKSSGPQEWADHCLFRMLGRVGTENDNLSLLAVTVRP